MRIGVISDTHIPEAMPALPPRVRELLADVAIILHLGDITTLDTLHELEDITITIAISGHVDPPFVQQYLPRKTHVQVGETRRVGLIHGDKEPRRFLERLSRWLSGGLDKNETILPHVYEAFRDDEPKVDVIAFGHSHVPYNRVHGGVLYFNPGTVIPRKDRPGTLGILDIDDDRIHGQIMPL
ncbi:MAG: metallophosphatase family protein [Chloroflexi bacterium]|nr:metallophosphatase family protein [Chloroflexota bacterium]MBU1750630.1 metallophosphatase family protein [Chloroflexota bacterium]MBU1879515.1 metallophosphatase family protein [Chloroflexota bacterium]